MNTWIKYTIFSIFMIIVIFHFFGLFYVYVFLLFVVLNGYLLNRRSIQNRIYKNYGRQETTDKLLTQSAGNFYLAVDPEDPQQLTGSSNLGTIAKPCPNCGSDLIAGLNYCEECGFKLE